ncbi:MAG: hypothetical protein NT016_01740 [Candidatus Aenigmarchaeota archaeon]|nr:hypothetical protein [Candidatus Aenigmarchaeota archaeon]
MTKKYELTGETKDFLGTTLHRIKALFAFDIVAKGELGGFIEAEKNLAQDGNAWVYGDALVSGDARVYGNALVYGKVKIDFTLCSRFNFDTDAKLAFWRKLEAMFETKFKE